MAGKRTYLNVVVDATAVLGAQIRAGRLERAWTLSALAKRAQISTPTLKKAERGDPGVAVGTMLQLAALVGVPLFDDDPRLVADAEAARSTLLSRRARPKPEPEADLDF